MIKTNTESVMSAFGRLSIAALKGDDTNCTVTKNDLATLLLAYQLELNKSESN